jgi:DNA-binding XRE family transcriptional regulator
MPYINTLIDTLKKRYKTSDEAAKAIGVSRQTLDGWRNGERNQNVFKAIEKLISLTSPNMLNDNVEPDSVPIHGRIRAGAVVTSEPFNIGITELTYQSNHIRNATGDVYLLTASDESLDNVPRHSYLICREVYNNDSVKDNCDGIIELEGKQYVGKIYPKENGYTFLPKGSKNASPLEGNFPIKAVILGVVTFSNIWN